MENKKNLLISCCLVIYSINSGQANEVDRGQMLYENHCVDCHADYVHNRENRKINTLMDLEKRVFHWQYHLKLDWSISDVNQVTTYLNSRFYKIPDLP